MNTLLPLTQGRELKYIKLGYHRRPCRLPLTQGRELKCSTASARVPWRAVAPHAGA